jgi:hypothetical protein
MVSLLTTGSLDIEKALVAQLVKRSAVCYETRCSIALYKEQLASGLYSSAVLSAAFQHAVIISNDSIQSLGFSFFQVSD